jgi:hypothetical protein
MGDVAATKTKKCLPLIRRNLVVGDGVSEAALTSGR